MAGTLHLLADPAINASKMCPTRQPIQYKIEIKSSCQLKHSARLGSVQSSSVRSREVSSAAFIFYSPCWRKRFSLVTIFSCSLIVTHSQDSQETFPAAVRVLKVVAIFYSLARGVHLAFTQDLCKQIKRAACRRAIYFSNHRAGAK